MAISPQHSPGIFRNSLKVKSPKEQVAFKYNENF